MNFVLKKFAKANWTKKKLVCYDIILVEMLFVLAEMQTKE